MNAGDIVKLKSGGPKMTILSRNQVGHFHCAWFVETTNGGWEVKKEAFPGEALEKA